MQSQDAADSSRATRLRRLIEGLGPYQSLVLLAVPTGLVEPLKLVAVAVAGDGHWITGTVMIVAAYAASLLLVERQSRASRVVLDCFATLAMTVGSQIPRYAAWTCLLLASSVLVPCMITLPLSST